MPRPLVFSNGHLLVALDSKLNIRELFFPHVGLYDHLCGQQIRMGVWVNGLFSWLDDGSWNIELGYAPNSLVSNCNATSTSLGVKLTIQDCLVPEIDAFQRVLKVQNQGHLEQDVRVFFNHDLKIAESDTGLTAFYHPTTDSIIHYKGPFTFLFGAHAAGNGLYAYNTGIRYQNGEDGTWKDAEDGALGMNPMCQGTIDSTLSVRLQLAAGEDVEATYTIVAGSSIDVATNIYRNLRAQTPMAHLTAARQKANGQLACLDGHFDGLPDEIRDFCRQSYLILKTQIDHNGGILAANDSDIMISNRAHYSYVWPRDGSLVARVLTRLGDHQTVEQYLKFCRGLENIERGYFFQKYQPDGTLGASWHPWVNEDGPVLPIQEDETALTLIALCDHLAATGTAHSNRAEWEPWASAMVNMLIGFRDNATELPLASHDLWEERRGIHAFTVATVIVALETGGKLFSPWNPALATLCQETAESMRAAFCRHFFDEGSEAFSRMLHPDLSPDTTPDSATLLVGLIGALPMDDARVLANAKFVKKWLTVKSDVGGLARYTGDWYWRQSEHYPGSPWIITTMWHAQTQIAAATNRADLREPLDWLRWAKRYANTTGVLPESLNPDTGQHLSVSPLTWSHSEVIKTALDWCEKRKSLDN